MDAEKNLEKLVERQRAYFAEGKTLSVDMRLQALERLEKALREGEEELCRALKADLLGNPGSKAICARWDLRCRSSAM